MAEIAATTAPVNIQPKRWPKHAVWLGVTVTIAGFVSYYLYFVRFPDLRDVPVLNLALVFLGVILTACGCWGVFKHNGGLLGRSLAGLGLLLTLGVAGMLNFYVFVMSYQLPESSDAPATEQPAPDFTLLDHHGQSASLSDYRGKKVVLVFYRGNW